MGTIRPAPILVWPTSELPICPVGNPTSGPCVTNVALGHVAIRRSKLGVCANRGAFAVRSLLSPQPSKMQSTVGVLIVYSLSVGSFYTIWLVLPLLLHPGTRL